MKYLLQILARHPDWVFTCHMCGPLTFKMSLKAHEKTIWHWLSQRALAVAPSPDSLIELTLRKMELEMARVKEAE